MDRREFLLKAFKFGGAMACASLGFSMEEIAWAKCTGYYCGAISSSGCVDTEYNIAQSASTNTSVAASNAHGMQFQVTTSGTLKKISVYFSALPASGNIVLRWGTSTDLTTYNEQVTIAVSSLTASQENDFVLVDGDSVSTGVNYYWGVYTTETGLYLRRDSTNPYAYNRYLSNEGDGWVMNYGDGADYRFSYTVCE